MSALTIAGGYLIGVAALAVSVIGMALGSLFFLANKVVGVLIYVATVAMLVGGFFALKFLLR